MTATAYIAERRPGHAGDATIFADLRLDNRAELLSALGVETHALVSDDALVLLAWKRWRRRCAERFFGDFAFAIWDDVERLLFCARDHIGARPLYYALTPHGVACASTIAALIDTPGVSREIDEPYLAATLIDRGFVAPDRTYLTAVRKLPPAHTLIARGGTLSIERYWFPDRVPPIRYRNADEYADAGRELIERAVDDRMRGGGAIGVHLSGGLDSSSVALFAARAHRAAGQAPPLAFAWQPPPDETTRSLWEHTCISAVANQEGLSVHYCPMNADDVLGVLRKDPAREPVTSTMLVETTAQRCAANNGCRLLLSGFGGDEGVSSRGRGYFSELLLRGQVGAAYRHARHKRAWPWKRIAVETALVACPDRVLARQRIAARRWRVRVDAPSWLDREFAQRAVPLRTPPCRESSVHAFMFWQWNNGGLAARMESWDFYGASYGIRYAYPLLDRRLLEFVAAIPSSQFADGASPRGFMRRVMHDLLPSDFASVDDKPVDAVRSNAALDTMRVALASAGRLLAGRTPARERYFDRSRLLAELDPTALEKRPRLGDLLRTMQFLDF